jgi:geranylgeranyl reductase
MHPAMLCTKVLVVGAGPAGSTAARFLSANGIDTIVVEKNPSFIKPCGGGIPSTAFDELEIPQRAIKKRVKKIKIISPRGDTVEIELEGGHIAIVQRGEFDSILREEAKNNGAQLIDAEFINFQEKDKQIIAKVTIDGEEKYIEADYLIAADGVNSRVRLKAGLKPVDSLYTLSERIKGIDSDLCEFWFSSYHASRAYSWVFPEAEGISVGTASNTAGELRELLKRFYERKGLNRETSTKKMYKIPLWGKEVYNKSNILFIGDASGHVMPFTFEGIYYSMKAGEFAASAILTGRLSEYKRLWKKRFYSRFVIMRKIYDYFLKDDISSERLIALFRREELQKMCMRLWLEKSSNEKQLFSFINFFRRILN